MKIASYRTGERESFGVVTPDGVIDAPDILGEGDLTLSEALQRNLLARLAQQSEGAKVTHAFSQIEYLPPVTAPNKVLCIGVNYVDHRAESGMIEIPEHPTVFTRFADSHVGHGHPVVRPSVTNQLDYEGEVAIVMASSVDPHDDDATLLAAIAGLSAYNDLSVRDWQLHNSQWIPGKNFFGVGAFGPWLVTLDEYDDLAEVRLTTRVNDKVVQDATLADLIFDFPTILRYISTFTPLAAGDVIITGTPGGVGVVADPPRFLQPGDRVSVEVTGAGILRNTIAEEPSGPHIQ